MKSKKRKTSEPQFASPQEVISRLDVEARTIKSPEVSQRLLITHFDNKQEPQCAPHRTDHSLYELGNLIPPILTYTDYMWLYERENRVYVPPWLVSDSFETPDFDSASKLPTDESQVVLPTININRQDSVPDSCPASPLYTYEVPESEGSLVE